MQTCMYVCMYVQAIINEEEDDDVEKEEEGGEEKGEGEREMDGNKGTKRTRRDKEGTGVKEEEHENT